MDERSRQLIEDGNRLFEKKRSLDSLHQEIAEHFYPEKANFTKSWYLGEDFAANMMTGYPALVRRDLGNAFSSMLRPPDIDWFEISVSREDKLDQAGKQWLEWATGVQRRAMLDEVSKFTRATTECDHDFAAFGQGCYSVELNLRQNALLYRSWHLKDLAWCEGPDGDIDEVHRKWKPTVQQLRRAFPKADLAPSLLRRLKDDRYGEVDVRHIVFKSDDYDPPEGQKRWRQPWVSVYIDVENQQVIEETGLWHRFYGIPRWATLPGSQYAHSPATTIALADARLLQAITLTLLEVGEKAANPPVIATQNAIRSDIQLFAGGVTWADYEYDERLGEVLRPLTQDKSGLQFGLELRNDTRSIIMEAFYLNKLNLPDPTREMTAYEVAERRKEYVRAALPLFGPMEDDYNGKLCNTTFELLFRNGAFGPPQSIPESLSSAEIQFRFKSPLHEAIEAQKGDILSKARATMALVADISPASMGILDATTALRDALEGEGVPEKWLRSDEQMQAAEQQAAQVAQAQTLLAGMTQAGAAAEQIGKARQALVPDIPLQGAAQPEAQAAA